MQKKMEGQYEAQNPKPKNSGTFWQKTKTRPDPIVQNQLWNWMDVYSNSNFNSGQNNVST